jgi:hypothetical protein
MEMNPENKIVKLCADGMAAEGQGREEDALSLFTQAWNESTDDFEKFTSAHFVARHQSSVKDKLKWDELALLHAEKIDDETIRGSYPSLYLNIGKCHEDLNDFEQARIYYMKAHHYIGFLPDDGYGKMIKSGIVAGIERLN